MGSDPRYSGEVLADEQPRGHRDVAAEEPIVDRDDAHIGAESSRPRMVQHPRPGPAREDRDRRVRAGPAARHRHGTAYALPFTPVRLPSTPSRRTEISSGLVARRRPVWQPHPGPRRTPPSDLRSIRASPHSWIAAAGLELERAGHADPVLVHRESLVGLGRREVATGEQVVLVGGERPADGRAARGTVPAPRGRCRSLRRLLRSRSGACSGLVLCRLTPSGTTHSDAELRVAVEHADEGVGEAPSPS